MITFLHFLSKALFVAAGGAFVIMIGMIILNGGHWPASLATVQNLFKTLHASFGPIAFAIQVAIFAGPGFLVMWLADFLESRRPQNSN